MVTHLRFLIYDAAIRLFVLIVNGEALKPGLDSSNGHTGGQNRVKYRPDLGKALYGSKFISCSVLKLVLMPQCRQQGLLESQQRLGIARATEQLSPNSTLKLGWIGGVELRFRAVCATIKTQLRAT